MSTAIAKTEPKVPTLRDHLESPAFAEQIKKALPKHLPPERFIRVACTTMMRTPKLAECDQVSFFNALLTLSQLGLEPDGRRAHLIPFNNTKRGVVECQLIVDYKGLVELAINSGQVANIHADVICDSDEFEYNCGEVVRHKIDFRKPRGEMYAAYAICSFKDGTKKSEVMAKDEIEAIRKRSRAGESGPWKTDFNEMAKKTVFRRLSKWLPLSPEARDAVEADDAQFDRTAQVSAPEFKQLKSESGKAALFPEIPAENAEVVEDDVPMTGATPLASTTAATAAQTVEAEKPAEQAEVKKPATTQETPVQSVARIMTESGVSFDDFRDAIKAGNGLLDTDSWASFDDVPAMVAEKLMADAKGTAKIIKMFGTKK